MLEFQGCSSEQDLLGVSVRGHKGLSTQDQRGVDRDAAPVEC